MQENAKFVIMPNQSNQQAVQPVQPQPVQTQTVPTQVVSTQPQVVQQQVPQVQNQNPQAVPNGSDISTSDLTQEVETDKNGRAKKPVISYRYTVINAMGKKEGGTFEAETPDDVRNFFLSLNYQVLEVKERSKLDVDIGVGKFTASDLSFSLTQLSTYLKAGIPLADSVKILAKQSKKTVIRKSFYELVYQLLKGESLSDAMDLQSKVYPRLLINMVKTAEMTGDLPSILDDMAEYYTSIDQTRKQMKSAMTYPVVVLLIAFGVLIFMLTYLVPQFNSLFESNGAKLPALTLAVMAVSNFIQAYWLYLIIGAVIFLIVFYELFTRVQKFRESVQIVLMHLPVFKDIIIYNEIANFTKTFASLLNHGVFITDSMEILSKITGNEIYKRIINRTLENLGKGDSISSAFKGEWAIPVVAYEMIVTGETTGQLGQMMEKVANHFQVLHKNVIDQMKSLVEPLLICFLAVVVGIILLSIIQPMFSIYSQIK
ncbi:MAG: type II secretion system F family protein [Bacilli bacterium]|nr:type II secretion system F family protein [Bacilli bacterium]